MGMITDILAAVVEMAIPDFFVDKPIRKNIMMKNIPTSIANINQLKLPMAAVLFVCNLMIKGMPISDAVK
jgi:hypothetical protein